MDLYQEIILEHYKNPLNVGNFDNVQGVKSEEKINVGCGDQITVYVLFSKDGKTIKDIKWQGVGCAISTASMSMVSEALKNRTVEQALKVDEEDILQLLGLEEINPGREKCLTLGLRAIKSVINKT